MKRALIFVLSLFASRRSSDDGFTVYVIREGNHYCAGWRLSPYGQSIRFIAKFDSSCIYDPGSITPGWNKLMGITGGAIHDNSVRIGWKSNGSGIDLCAYYYIKSTRVFKYLCSVSAYDEVYCYVEWTSDGYVISANDILVEVDSVLYPKLGLFKCYPYFGGESPAPNDMKIFIKEQ